MSDDKGDDNGTRTSFQEEQERENALKRYYEVRDLVGRVRNLLEVYTGFKTEGELEQQKRIAGTLRPLVEQYLAANHPVERLEERCRELLPELTALVPASPQPSPSPPPPSPAARAEQPRIVSPTPEPQPPQPAEVLCAGYILMPQTRTYQLGVHALRQACEEQWPNIENADSRHIFVRPDSSRIYRPLTSRETIQAQVNSYEQSTPEDRLKLFGKWQDSCTGAAYQARTTKFKLIPQCEQLITIPADFNGEFLNVPYNTWDVPELDSAAPKAKFNRNLTPNEVEENDGWRTAAEHDLPLLRTYRDIVWDAYAQRYNRGNRPERLMGFYVLQNTPTDELRAWFVQNLSSNSGTSYRYNLNSSGSFLRVAP